MLMDCKSTRTNQWTVSKRSVRKTRAATGHSAWLEMSTEVVGAILGGDASERRHAKRSVLTCRMYGSCTVQKEANAISATIHFLCSYSWSV